MDGVVMDDWKDGWGCLLLKFDLWAMVTGLLVRELNGWIVSLYFRGWSWLVVRALDPAA